MSRRGLEMVRRLILMTASVACVLAVSLASAASASATQRIDMKVLLLGTSTTEPNFEAWQSELQREGVPYEAIITSKGHAAITAATLSDTLSNGTQEAKYQAIVESVGGLPLCPEAPATGECVPALSATERTAIEEYEQTFNVRQITGEAFPTTSTTYGLNPPTKDGEFAETFKGTLTTEGKTVFPYLNGPVAFSTGTYGYETTPLTTQATGASFHTLVEGSTKTALVGIYTRPSGVQEMVYVYNETRPSCSLSCCAMGR